MGTYVGTGMAEGLPKVDYGGVMLDIYDELDYSEACQVLHANGNEIEEMGTSVSLPCNQFCTRLRVK